MLRQKTPENRHPAQRSTQPNKRILTDKPVPEERGAPAHRRCPRTRRGLQHRRCPTHTGRAQTENTEDRRPTQRQTLPNNRVQATAASVRSCLAPAFSRA